MRKWAYALYLFVTSVKGISSTRLAQYIDVSQKTAWFMLHRLREAWSNSGVDQIKGMEKFLGPVEVDETYVGGQIKNMSNAKRRALRGRASTYDNKTAVVGIKDRATNQVVAQAMPRVNQEEMDAFLDTFADPDAEVYTDGATVYKGIDYDHSWVNHSIRQYVEGKVHTNGIESFWATLKRAYKGTYHWMSVQHLERYVAEFAGRHNIRDLTVLAALSAVVVGLIGKRLLYRELTNNPAKVKAAKADAIGLEPKPRKKPIKLRPKRPVRQSSWDGPITITVDPGRKQKRRVRVGKPSSKSLFDRDDWRFDRGN